jgi:hypothetical protein
MSQLLRILAILASVSTLFVFLELIRRAQLRAQYALLWLLGSAIILVISILWGTMATIASSLGIEDAPWSFLLAIGFLLALIIQVFHTIAISNLAEHNRDLAQRMAILEWYTRQLRKQAQQLVSTTEDQGQDLWPAMENCDLEEESIVDEERIREAL